MEKCRLVFSGSGGQGVITAAIVFAEAAVLFENLNAVQYQSYGPEARGGSARSDVIISDSQINFPKVIQSNVLICLTQEAYETYNRIVRPGGILLTDTRFVKPNYKIDAKHINLPMYQSVMDEIGKPIVFNICVLGALIKIVNFIKTESIIKVLNLRIPSEFIEINQKALEIGSSLVNDSVL